MHATVSFGPSLTRTTLTVPERQKTTDAVDNADEAVNSQLPTFRGRSAGGSHPPLSVSILRRSIKTQTSLRGELKSILNDSGHPHSRALIATSIPSVALCRQVPCRNTPADTAGPGHAVEGSVHHSTRTGHVRELLLRLVNGAVPPEVCQQRRDEAAFDTGLAQPFHVAAAERFADHRPPSRGAVSLFREKLFLELDAALPQALLDGEASYAASTSSVVHPDALALVALPENIMIPCASRSPEAVYSPSGVDDIIAETKGIQQPLPTAHVRALQRQAFIEAPSRSHGDALARHRLRPRSVDVTLGGPPRPPLGAVVVKGAPTRATSAARHHAAEARRFLQAQQAVASTRTEGGMGTRLASSVKVMQFRTGVVRPQQGLTR